MRVMMIRAGTTIGIGMVQMRFNDDFENPRRTQRLYVARSVQDVLGLPACNATEFRFQETRA